MWPLDYATPKRGRNLRASRDCGTCPAGSLQGHARAHRRTPHASPPPAPSFAANISIAGYVQISDVEQECDGLLSYDRTAKFSVEDTALIRAANIALVGAPVDCMPLDAQRGNAARGGDSAMTEKVPPWLKRK